MPQPSGEPEDIAKSVLGFSGVAGPSVPRRVVKMFTTSAAGDMKLAESRRWAFASHGRSAAVDPRKTFFLKQVHGAEVVRVTSDEPPREAPAADGMVTDVPGAVLCIFVADCLPILVWEKTGRAVGVFHAGWRGVAKGMPRRAIESFQENFGIGPGELAVEIGPCIGRCCFRVGPETAAQFPPEVKIEREGGTYVDLRRDAWRQIRAAGVGAPHAELILCTACSSTMRFFSFRRDKTDKRMMAFIAIDPK